MDHFNEVEIFSTWMEKLPKFDSSIDANIILNGVYDLAYGIFNHNAHGVNPLSKVSAHPTEDIMQDNRFSIALKHFIDSDVYNQTGVSFENAINMPVYAFQQLCKVSKEIALKKSQITKSALDSAAIKSGLPKTR